MLNSNAHVKRVDVHTIITVTDINNDIHYTSSLDTHETKLEEGKPLGSVLEPIRDQLFHSTIPDLIFSNFPDGAAQSTDYPKDKKNEEKETE